MAIVYDRYDYLEEKREALSKWTDYVLKLVEEHPPEALRGAMSRGN